MKPLPHYFNTQAVTSETRIQNRLCLDKQLFLSCSSFTCKTTSQGYGEAESLRRCSRNGSSRFHSYSPSLERDHQVLSRPSLLCNTLCHFLESGASWDTSPHKRRCQKHYKLKSICYLGPQMSAPCSQKRSHIEDAN